MIVKGELSDEQINKLKELFKTDDDDYAVKRANELMQILRDVFGPLALTITSFAREMLELAEQAIIENKLEEFKDNESIGELFSKDDKMSLC